MNRYITINKATYLIRGPYTATQVRAFYKAFKTKHPTYLGSLSQWAVYYGKVYMRVH